MSETTQDEPDPIKMALRQAVRFFYDLQKLRIQQGNRGSSETIMLDPADREFHEHRSSTLSSLERKELRHIEKLCRRFSVYPWLKKQRGVGPTLAGVMLSEIDIRRAETPSALWKFAGLDVQDGQAPKRTKGQKNTYNSFLRTKLVGVMGDCLIKSRSEWREFYDNQKHRRQHQLVDVCAGCAGKGKALKGDAKGKKCPNCNGTGGPAPWGQSDGHRHRDAIRKMVKMFLLELWKQWRAAENLPVHPSYAEAVLGRVHGDHGGAGVHAP
jgi:hypothetical protein